MIRRISICTLAVVGLVAVAVADVPDLTLSDAVIDAAAVGAGLTIAPNGIGPTFDEAYDQFGNVVDATITLTLVNNQGNPIAGYPPEDIWLETSGGSLASCVFGSSPDDETDANGQAIWFEPMRAGGCTVGESTIVYVAGSPLVGSDLDLVFRSFDFNGDLDVDLTDIVIFTQSIGTDFECADYNNDGVINLADIVRITPGIGGDCTN